MAIGDGNSNPEYIYLASGSSNTATLSTTGNVYYNTTSNTMHISTGTHWAPVTTYATTYTTPNTTFTWNGNPNDLMASSGSRIFRSVEEQIEYQQQAYEEPRDHAYNPGWNEVCEDCYAHNLHRLSPDKHLFVIDEEIPWSDRLAS